MAGVKETFDIELNPEMMAFIQAAKEKYEIASQDKVVRIIMDYIESKSGYPRHCVHGVSLPALRVETSLLGLAKIANLGSAKSPYIPLCKGGYRGISPNRESPSRWLDSVDVLYSFQSQVVAVYPEAVDRTFGYRLNV